MVARLPAVEFASGTTGKFDFGHLQTIRAVLKMVRFGHDGGQKWRESRLLESTTDMIQK